MTRKISALALGVGMLLASAQAFAHGHHSHGPALTEAERQASEGIFADKDVQDRALSDWEGVWQSVNPYLLNGDFDPVLEQKAKKPGGKSVAEYREYYKKGYATDVDQIGIEDNVMEFHVGETVNSCKYPIPATKFCITPPVRKACVTCSSASRRCQRAEICSVQRPYHWPA
jgi:Zn/Cd-binding protein ZinT